MKIKTIINKSNINSKFIRTYLNIFFRKNKFESGYVYVLTKLSYNSGKTLSLGKKTLIDVSSKGELKTYVDLTADSFSSFSADNKDAKINKVMICYIETNKEYYDNYIKTLMMSKDFE